MNYPMKPATQPVTQTWTYTQDGDGDHAIWNGEELIAVTDGWGIYISEVRRTREEDEANARLLSSAPELLEALQSVIGFFEDWSVEIGPAEETLLERVNAAIAKATGAEGTR